MLVHVDRATRGRDVLAAVVAVAVVAREVASAALGVVPVRRTAAGAVEVVVLRATIGPVDRSGGDYFLCHRPLLHTMQNFPLPSGLTYVFF